MLHETCLNAGKNVNYAEMIVFQNAPKLLLLINTNKILYVYVSPTKWL